MNDSRPVVLAFSAQQVMALTGPSYGQLAYWDRQGFFKPEYPSGCPGAPYDRVYSFRDVVGLRTLSVLRHKHGVSLQQCRKVAAELAAYTKRHGPNSRSQFGEGALCL